MKIIEPTNRKNVLLRKMVWDNLDKMQNEKKKENVGQKM